jgi:hypothetical protein
VSQLEIGKKTPSLELWKRLEKALPQEEYQWLRTEYAGFVSQKNSALAWMNSFSSTQTTEVPQFEPNFKPLEITVRTPRLARLAQSTIRNLMLLQQELPGAQPYELEIRITAFIPKQAFQDDIKEAIVDSLSGIKQSVLSDENEGGSPWPLRLQSTENPIDEVEIEIDGIGEFPPPPCPQVATISASNSDEPQVYLLLPSLCTRAKKKINALLASEVPLGIAEITLERHGLKSGGVIADAIPIDLASKWQPQIRQRIASILRPIAGQASKAFPNVRFELWVPVAKRDKRLVQVRLMADGPHLVSLMKAPILTQALSEASALIKRLPIERQRHLEVLKMSFADQNGRFDAIEFQLRNGERFEL